VTLHADRFMDIMSDLTLFDMSMCALMILAALEAAGARSACRCPPWLSSRWRSTRSAIHHWRQLAASARVGRNGDDDALCLDAGSVWHDGEHRHSRRRHLQYVIFGSLLMAIGAGNVFMRAATLVAGRTFGGPAKVAVVTSACSAPSPGPRSPT